MGWALAFRMESRRCCCDGGMGLAIGNWLNTAVSHLAECSHWGLVSWRGWGKSFRSRFSGSTYFAHRLGNDILGFLPFSLHRSP
jgi:hypothetical protein